MEDLFTYTTDQQNEDEMQDIRDLINDYPMLVKTRETSQCWQGIFKSMHQICNGTFLCAHPFDNAWMNKVIGKYDLYEIKFTWTELVMRTRQILDYLKERKPQGFWYPKTDRFSLNDFFCSTMKSGKCWSPFIELAFVDFCTPAMWRKIFGPKISEKLDEILKDVWFAPLDFNDKCRFYKAVDVFHDWYADLPEEFINKCDANHLVFGKFSTLLENIRQCNKETGCVFPSFIGPNSVKWIVLKNWLKDKKKVEW